MNGYHKTPYTFPYNLLLSIKADSKLILPHTISADHLRAIEYALSTLEPYEKAILDKQYRHIDISDELKIQITATTKEISHIEQDALQKLRHPSIWNYIQYGIVGYQKLVASEAHSKGYLIGYSTGYRACAADIQSGTYRRHAADLYNQPLDAMHLSSRSHHCLINAGCTKIADVVELSETAIARMRGLGKLGAKEVALRLQSIGITNTPWDIFAV